MAITISIGNASGIDFSAYLKAFETGFTKTGYGSFSNPTDDFGFSAEDYVSYDETTGQSVIFGSGDDDWTYDLTTHVISGSLDTIQFGFNTEEDTATETYSNDSDVLISGIGLDDTSTSSGTVVNDLMNSETGSLIALLKTEEIVFKGSAGADTFSAYGHDDTLNGGKGADVLKGAGGEDAVLGAGGSDTLYGGKGDDTLTGGKGNDVLFGNKGADTFVFAGTTGQDTINDFQAGTDVIELDSALLADFDAVQAAANDTDAGVVINWAGGSLLLKGLDAADLSAGDFDFV